MLSSGEDEIRLVPCAEIVAESMRLAGNQVHCIAMKSFVKVAHEVMYIVPKRKGSKSALVFAETDAIYPHG